VEGVVVEITTGSALTVSVRVNASTFLLRLILIALMNPKNESQLKVLSVQQRI
jgi:hypothetical protein